VWSNYNNVDRISFACGEMSGEKISCLTREVSQHMLTPGSRMSLHCAEHSLTFSSEEGKQTDFKVLCQISSIVSL
jgi:hypothetical protein